MVLATSVGNIGELYRLDRDSVLVETLSRELIDIRQNTRIEIIVERFRLKNLSQSQCDSLVNEIINTRGQEVILNKYGKNFTAIILPDITITQQNWRGCILYSVGFDAERVSNISDGDTADTSLTP